MGNVQRTYAVNPDIGFPGSLARPSEPHATGSGIIHVPGSATRNPRPGDALYYDETENKFAVPTTAAQSALACAILGYRADQVAQADSTVQFSDDDEIQFFTFGTVWVTAGSAMEYGQRIAWDRADYQWDPAAALIATADGSDPATTQALANALKTYLNAPVRCPVVCVSRNPVAANGIAMAQIGFGRSA